MTFGSPWMALFGDDFFESERVAEMDDSATLLYLWLLWRQFKHGPLPPADVLRRLPHRWQVTWDKVWPQVAPCFDEIESGRLENQRCREIRADAVLRSERAKTNGLRGGRPTRKPTANPTPKPSVSQRGASGKPTANPEQSSDRIGSDRTEEKKHPSGAVPAADAADRAPQPRKAPAGPRSPPTGPHAEVIAGFVTRFERATGKPYDVEGAKDGNAAKALLERGGGDVAAILQRADWYFAEPFHRRTGFSLTRFLAAWNTLAKPAGGVGGKTPENSMRAFFDECDRVGAQTIEARAGRVA